MSPKTVPISALPPKGHRDLSAIPDDALVYLALAFPTPTALMKNDRKLYDELVRRDLYQDHVRPALLKASELKMRPYSEAADAALLELAARFLGRMELNKSDPALKAELVRRELWETALPKRRATWDEDAVRRVAGAYTSRQRFAAEQPAAFYWASKLDILATLFPTEAPLPRDTRKRHWTLDKIAASAQLCATRSDFYRKFPGAYAAARTSGYLDLVCAHMDRRLSRPSSKTMTNVELMQEAARFETPNAFLRENRAAYNQIVARGLYRQVAETLKWPPHRD